MSDRQLNFTIQSNMIWLLLGLIVNNLLFLEMALFIPERHFAVDIFFIVTSMGLLMVVAYRVSKPPLPEIDIAERPAERVDGIARTETRANQSAERNTRERSAESNGVDNSIFDYLPEIFCIKDGKGRWRLASEAYLEFFGLKDVAYVGKTDHELALGADVSDKIWRKAVLFDEHAWKKGGELRTVETIDTNGLLQNLEVARKPVFDAEGQREMLVLTATDVTRREKSKRALELASTAFEYNTQGIMIFDGGLKIVRANQACFDLIGFTPMELKGTLLSRIMGNGCGPEFYQTLQTYLISNGQWHGEMNCRRRDGSTFAAWFSLVTVKTRRGTGSDHYLGSIRDISEKKAAEERMIRLAHFDDLTGLPNRLMFSDRLTQVLSRSKRHHLINALLFIDLDRFKSINDTQGHYGGDLLLKQAAERLMTVLRREDHVARLGGDEFAVFLENQKSAEKTIYTASLVAHKLISLFTKPFVIQGQEVFLGASIGIAIYPQDADNYDDLLKNASAAMYHAKRQGRNNYQFFKKELTLASKNKVRLDRALRKAFDLEHLRLHYQPQFEARSREICGAEVLLRWEDPKMGMISPAKFVPLAEETGMIVPIGKWILHNACRKMKTWVDAGYPLKRISVNLSARQFCEPAFIQSIEDILAATGLQPERLELEITESVLMDDTKRAELVLLRLSRMGIGLAIDDFGTGYSSLAYLKNFPINVLKVDQSFVREISSNASDAAISSAIITLAHSLGMKVIAEGVETEEQLLFLQQRGCDMIQGYLLSRPLPVFEMERLLKKEPKDQAQEQCTPPIVQRDTILSDFEWDDEEEYPWR
ncbi:MAG: EAL domain-containing protein [Pseudomonadota bacterium]